MNDKILENLQKSYYSEEPIKQRDYQKKYFIKKDYLSKQIWKTMFLGEER